MTDIIVRVVLISVLFTLTIFATYPTKKETKPDKLFSEKFKEWLEEKRRKK